MTLHFMSDKELSRLEILRDLGSGRLTTSVAAELLGLERRQVYRLLEAFRAQGPDALIPSAEASPATEPMARSSARPVWPSFVSATRISGRRWPPAFSGIGFVVRRSTPLSSPLNTVWRL